ncbi:MAG TPA: aminoglycoside phosphotransferase family protein [Herpetosiphonaceae bacterium]
MNTPPSWQTTTSLLVPHPSLPAILLLAADDGWALPSFYAAELRWAPEVEWLGPLWRERFGFPPIVLGCAWADLDREQKIVDAILSLEAPPADWPLPPGGRWVDRAQLADLTLARPAHLAALGDHLAEAESGVIPEKRPPWARPGWHDRAAAWIRRELETRGAAPTGPSQQLKTWGISAILRTPTEAGDYYFKVASQLPLFADEPRVTAVLAARFPAHAPAPVAIERREQWMLLADFGPALEDEADGAVWRETLLAYGRMQRAAEPLVDELLAAGCLDRRLPVLADQITALLRNDLALALLADDERARIQALLPEFLAVIGRLAERAIPETLVHGDCHSGNVAWRGGQPLIFDWTDACVAHPFMDAMCLLRGLPESFGAEEREGLRDAYLALWGDAAAPERLREAWALCMAAEHLHQAVSYYHIVEAMEPRARFEFDRAVPGHLRRALEAYEALPAS